MNAKIGVSLCVVVAIGLIASCTKFEPPAHGEDQVLDGPVDGLTYAQSAQHGAGDLAFTGQIFNSATGLGPLFVATSCGSCHAGDGKGHPFTTLTRFGKTDSNGRNEFINGPQLQERALPGYEPEQLPINAVHAKFTPPANTGLGYIELVSEQDILAMADANAGNVDGIRGRPNLNLLPPYISPGPDSYHQGNRYITRFGKKAATYSLLHQTVVAYNQDMGITSSFEPRDAFSMHDIEPEVSDKIVSDVVFYLQTLKAPIQREQDKPQVKNGKALFIKIGCETCHKETLHTGYSTIEALSNKSFHPYTDLLLHDMGPALDDGYTEGSARTSEWRTAPLWGLGLSPKSQGGEYFLLHDGRAKTIEDAIGFHDGEAIRVKNKFVSLTEDEKKNVLRFLKSL